MAFMDFRFPMTMAEGMQGGRGWQTPMVFNRGGHRKVNEDWSEPLGEWHLEQRNRTEAETKALQGFFHAVARGRANSFRLHDPKDSLINNVVAPRILSTNTFQLRQRFSFSWRGQAATYFLNVTKPWPNDHDAIVRVGGVPTLNYSINTTTGVLTPSFTVPSNVGVFVTIRYDIEVFFLLDRFDPIQTEAGYWTWPDIRLREERA